MQITHRLYCLVTLVSRSSLIIADIVVVIITWRKTYQTYQSEKDLPLKNSFTRVVLLDGESSRSVRGLLSYHLLRSFRVLVHDVSRMARLFQAYVLSDPTLRVITSLNILHTALTGLSVRGFITVLGLHLTMSVLRRFPMSRMARAM